MLSVLIAVIIVIVSVYTLSTIIKPTNFPPGPQWYPFLGCSTLVRNLSREHGSQWRALSNLAKQYSTNILGLKLGSELVVVVYGEKNIKQVFIEPEFEGRPNSFFLRLRSFGKRIGITSADGPLWKEHRQFTVKHLKNVGFGKSDMENDIQQEMLNLVQFIGKNNGKPITPRSKLATAVMNVLWKYVAGEQIKEDRLKLLLELLQARSCAFSMAGGWLNQLPCCRYLFPEYSGYSLIVRINNQLSQIIEEAITNHKNKKIMGKDFIYSFLEEMEENKSIYTEEQLKVICLDLFIAGSQTTSNALEFAFLTVLRNASIQEKINDEIRNVLRDAVPTWADSSRMVYTSAFLLEVYRYYTIAPLVGPRRVLSDTVIDGFSIPKDTTVLLSVGDLHIDPQLWEDPHTFKPERFINEEGLLKKTEHLYPFGLGRRRCPGDALAKSFIFIIFVGILQKYMIKCTNGILPSDEPIIGLISAPKVYGAEFVARS